MAIRRFSGSNLSGSKSSKIWDQTTTPGHFESIATISADSSGTSSITFNNIPQNYTHLQLRGSLLTSYTGGNSFMGIRLNGDSTASYTYHYTEGDASSVFAVNETTSSGSTAAQIGRWATSSNSNTLAYGVGIIDILDYKNTSKNKVLRTLSGWHKSGANGYISFGSAMWTKTDAINSITCYFGGGAFNFQPYSTISLYGIMGS